MPASLHVRRRRDIPPGGPPVAGDGRRLLGNGAALRRDPGSPVSWGGRTHIWRLFRTRAEARLYMGEYYGRDSEGRDWAETLSVETFEDLLARHAQRS